jgi:hypothetical protein
VDSVLDFPMTAIPIPQRQGIRPIACSKQAPRIGGWHGSILLCFVRMVPKSVKTTENSGPVSNADDHGKSNAKL